MYDSTRQPEAPPLASSADGARATCERIGLKPLVADHAETFHRLINDWEICRLLPEAPFPYPLELAREWIAAAEADAAAGRAQQFAVTDQATGMLIGSAGLRIAPDGHSASLGYWLGRRYWGQGLGSEAAREMVRWGFAHLAIDRIEASVAPDNAASIAVLERIGFRETGKGSAVFMCRPGVRMPVIEYAITREMLDFGAPHSEVKPLLLVAACALIDKTGAILLTRRPAGKKLAGLWEFPGGKLMEGETPEAALTRELREELGITVREADLAPLAFASHAYESFHLLMPLYLCRRWQGTPQPLEGQGLAWVPTAKLDEYPVPPADRPLIPLLRDFL